MFYNLLNYSNDNISISKTPFLRDILDDVEPDLFMVCELESESGSNYLFTNAIDPHNPDFEKATFEINQSSGSSLQQMVYYNGKKLVLESQVVIEADTRDINHYRFRLNTENSNTNPIRLEVFVAHLKASRGASNRQRRLASVEEFASTLQNLPSNSFVLFAGDFNFYTSNEEGYFRLISDQNAIQMIDPINRPAEPFPNNAGVSDPFEFYSSSSIYFWRHSSFADIHSQSTRTSNSGLIDASGSGGGMDDRFDFIMMSENFNSSSNLFYVPNSYKTIGNNGNCYNNFVANSNCSGTYTQSLRNSLWQFSDHLPIVMEIETPENTLSTNSFAAQLTLPRGNIANESLEIKIPVELKNRISAIIIYDINGRKLIEKKLINQNLNQPLTLATETLSSGIYYLSTNLGSKALKFLKK